MRAVSQEIHQPLTTKISLKITHQKFTLNLPGANELKLFSISPSQVCSWVDTEMGRLLSWYWSDEAQLQHHRGTTRDHSLSYTTRDQSLSYVIISLSQSSYCLLNRLSFELSQILLHPELTWWWSFLCADSVLYNPTFSFFLGQSPIFKDTVQMFLFVQWGYIVLFHNN